MCSPDMITMITRITSRIKDDDGNPINYSLWTPTTAQPGSREKIEVMMYRASKGLPIFHPLDCDTIASKAGGVCAFNATLLDVENDEYYEPKKIRRRLRSTGHHGKRGKKKDSKCKKSASLNKIHKLPSMEVLLAS